MTQAILTAHSIVTRAVEGLFDLIRSMNEKRIQDKEIRATEKALSKLSDKDLHDIGITRGDIYGIARNDKTLERIRKQTNENLKGWV